MKPGENLSEFVYLCSYGQTAAADGLGLRGHCNADVFAILEQYVERMAAKHKKPTSQYYGELEARKQAICTTTFGI